jgi:putative zinc finger protein
MTCELARERINELVDGTLDRAARVELDAHLATCAACAELAEDLEIVLRASRSLPPLDPPERVWLSVSRAVAASGAPAATHAPRREWINVTLAVAAVLLAAVVITLVVRSGRTPAAGNASGVASSGQPVSGASAQAGAPTTDSAELRSLQSELQQAESHYVNAIQKLEVLARDRRALNAQDAAILQKNLLVIDSAIGESRAALKAQPTSDMAQESLFEAFRSKIALLQDTISLINEMRKGNQAEAARISGGLNKS